MRSLRVAFLVGKCVIAFYSKRLAAFISVLSAVRTRAQKRIVKRHEWQQSNQHLLQGAPTHMLKQYANWKTP